MRPMIQNYLETIVCRYGSILFSWLLFKSLTINYKVIYNFKQFIKVHKFFEKRPEEPVFGTWYYLKFFGYFLKGYQVPNAAKKCLGLKICFWTGINTQKKLFLNFFLLSIFRDLVLVQKAKKKYFN
jgi:hypothetical protein